MKYLRVKPGGRKRARLTPVTQIDSKKRSVKGVTFSFESVSRERWETAFGKFDPEKFRRAKAEQDRAKAQGVVVDAPAVHGDNKGPGRRLYRGFDYGLGAFVEGRSHRKQLMRENAEGPLREAR